MSLQVNEFVRFSYKFINNLIYSNIVDVLYYLIIVCATLTLVTDLLLSKIQLVNSKMRYKNTLKGTYYERSLL